MSSDVSEKTVNVIRDLARAYKDTQQELEQSYKREMLNSVKILELESQCDTLTEEFRILQQNLIRELEEKNLKDFIRISEIFDEIRILYIMALDSLKYNFSKTEESRAIPGVS